jgi:hypothetical protein
MVVENKRLQHWRRTSAQWVSENPVLHAGEVGFVSDNLPEFRVGDGVTAWNDLTGLPELATSDPGKVPVGSTGILTTLDVDELAWRPLVSRLTADHAGVTNSATVVDSGLTVPVTSNATYLVTCYFTYTATATVGDIKFQWSTPAGVTGSWTPRGGPTGQSADPIASYRVTSLTWAQAAGIAGMVAETNCTPTGILITAGTPGNLVLQYAQNAATPGETVVLKAQSTLIVQRLL